MKNIQIIDGADNTTYSIFAATEEEFAVIFPGGTDIEFAEDFFERAGDEIAGECCTQYEDGRHGFGLPPLRADDGRV